MRLIHKVTWRLIEMMTWQAGRFEFFDNERTTPLALVSQTLENFGRSRSASARVCTRAGILTD